MSWKYYAASTADREIEQSPHWEAILTRDLGGHIPDHDAAVYYDDYADCWRECRTRKRVRGYRAGDAAAFRPRELSVREAAERAIFSAIMDHPAGRVACYEPVLLDGELVELRENRARGWHWYNRATKERKPFAIKDLDSVVLSPKQQRAVGLRQKTKPRP